MIRDASILWRWLRPATVAVAVLTFTAIATRASDGSGGSTRAEECADTVRPAVSAVTLHLADRVGLSRDAREEMMRQTIHLWRRFGVDVQWSIDSPVVRVSTRRDTHVHVNIIVRSDSCEGEPRPTASKARRVASILFVDGKPTTLISAYPAEVQRLLDAVRLDDKGFGHLASIVRQRLLGRVLGRVVAHELGHFVFASADHGRFGLMRATHRIEELLAPFDRPFQIVAPQPPACVVASLSARHR